MAINGLPPHLSEKDVPEAAVEWRHQWLYSMIPVGIRHGNNYPLIPYLTGYCRNCGKGFSQRINFLETGGYNETIMNVPQTGCIGPS
jgi:hypothetical protein